MARTRAEVQDPAATPLNGIMSTRVITAGVKTPVSTTLNLMLDNDVSRVPIVDERGRVVGIISKTDLLEEDLDARGSSLTCAEVMTRQVLTLRPDASVAEAAALMSSRRLHGVPIVTSEGTLVGLVSALDVLAWLARER